MSHQQSHKKIMPQIVLLSLEHEHLDVLLDCKLHLSGQVEPVLIVHQNMRSDHFPVEHTYYVESLSEAFILLTQRSPAVLQTFDPDVHQQVVSFYQKQSQRPFLIASHLTHGVKKSRQNHRYFNKLTELNIFFNSEVEALSGQAKWLKLQNPVNLCKYEDRLKWSLYQQSIDDLVFPDRVTFNGVHKKDYSDIRLSYITHFYCNQNDISSVINLLKRYECYPTEIISRVQFIIVDDGSPIEYEIPEFRLNLIWLKIMKDIPWNQGGARNLGVTFAKSDTLFMADSDHEVPEQSMRKLIKLGYCGRRLYKMKRKNQQTGELYAGHSNLFVMSRGRFFECFGYDEEFSGAYGAEDFRFVKYQKAMGSRQMYLPDDTYAIERKDIDDKKSYHTLKRDLSFNSAKDSRKRDELANFGHGYGHSRMFLEFEFKVLKQLFLPCVEPRKVDKWWKRRWLLRLLKPRY
ncbi:glycosyltransferase family A protein [Neisseria sp. Ec49-e6-T10]|uniref:glycosyltransferase family A protein n=1 Tax=Neisseria sp. Ec49-e6-T10 TaxID=3140744 RepID=UPI003EC074AD